MYCPPTSDPVLVLILQVGKWCQLRWEHQPRTWGMLTAQCPASWVRAVPTHPLWGRVSHQDTQENHWPWVTAQTAGPQPGMSDSAGLEWGLRMCVLEKGWHSCLPLDQYLQTPVLHEHVSPKFNNGLDNCYMLRDSLCGGKTINSNAGPAPS